MENNSSLGREIKGIAIQFIENLQEVDDFTQKVTQSIKKINKPNHNALFEKYNKFISEFRKDMFLKMGHVYLISIYEGFTEEFFSTLQENRSDISNLSHHNIDNVNEFIANNFNFSLKEDFPNWCDLKENYYRRHTVVHQNACIDEKFIQNMKGCKDISLENIGQKFKYSYPYIEECLLNISNYIVFLFENIIEEYHLNIQKTLFI